jgi:hypothetical protein
MMLKPDKLADEIMGIYGEWIEMGYPAQDILFVLLLREKEKNNILQKRLNVCSRVHRNG